MECFVVSPSSWARSALHAFADTYVELAWSFLEAEPAPSDGELDSAKALVGYHEITSVGIDVCCMVFLRYSQEKFIVLANQKTFKAKQQLSHMTFEEEFKALLESNGWKVLRYGWPDYAAIAPDRTKMFFELKDGEDKVSRQQVEMHNFLEELGAPVYVVCNKTLRRNLYSLYRKKHKETQAPFKILRVLQEGGWYKAEDIARIAQLSSQLVAYHLRFLVDAGIVRRNREGYGITDDYSAKNQLTIFSKMKPFIDEVRLRSKDDKEAAEKIVNYFMVLVSNLFVKAETTTRVSGVS